MDQTSASTARAPGPTLYRTTGPTHGEGLALGDGVRHDLEVGVLEGSEAQALPEPPLHVTLSLAAVLILRIHITYVHAAINSRKHHIKQQRTAYQVLHMISYSSSACHPLNERGKLYTRPGTRHCRCNKRNINKRMHVDIKMGHVWARKII